MASDLAFAFRARRLLDMKPPMKTSKPSLAELKERENLLP